MLVYSGFTLPETDSAAISTKDKILLKENNNDDTVKIRNLIALSYLHIDNNKIDSAIILSKEAYQLSVEKSFQYGLAHSQLILARAYNMKSEYPQSLSFYLKSLNELKNAEDHQIISDINYEIGMMYYNGEVYEKAIEYFRISDKYIYEDEPKHMTVLQSIASTYESLNLPDSAIFYYSKVLEYYNLHHDIKSSVSILEIISNINKNAERYNESIDNELIMLKHYQTLGLVSGEISTLNNLGFLYKYLNDFDKSLSYFKKAIALSDDKKQMSSIYLNIAVIYYNQGNYESALNYLFDALKICRSNKNLLETAKVYNLLASTYFLIEDFETAINYAKMAIEIGEKIENSNLLYQSYLILSNIYQEEGNFEVALEYYTKYSTIKNSLNETDQQRETEILAKKYSAEKTEKELRLFMAEKELRDLTLKQLLLEKEKREKELSLQKENNLLLQKKYELEKASSAQRLQLISQKLISEQQDREISELNNDKKIKDLALKQKETEKKEQDKEIQLLEQNNLLLEQEKQLDKLKVEKAKVTRNLLIVAVLVAAFVLGLILYYYFRKLKTNRLLTRKNEEINQQKISIERQAEELHDMNEHLKKLDSFKESLTGMIVHDLKNPLNTLLNTSQIDRVKLLANKMLLMVMNILDIQKFEDAALELDLKQESLNFIVDTAIDQVILSATEKNIEIINNTQKTSTVKIDADIIERVYVNLLTNAIKYTPVNGSVLINARSSDNEFIRVEVSDTGQGIPNDKKHLVFEKFKQVDAKKLGEIRSSGLGLSFCKLAIEAHGGTIGVESEMGEGATFWFTLKGSDSSKPEEIADQKTIKIKNNEISASTYLVLKPFITSLQKIKYYEITELRKVLAQIDDSMLNSEIVEWKEKLTNAISSGNKLLYEELINLNEHEA